MLLLKHKMTFKLIILFGGITEMCFYFLALLLLEFGITLFKKILQYCVYLMVNSAKSFSEKQFKSV